MAKKTTCPITRAQFRDRARPVKVVIDGKEHDVPAKEFSTGSLGWYLNAKTTIQVDGVSVPVQIGLNLTIVGSKELPQDAAEPPAPAASVGVPESASSESRPAAPESPAAPPAPPERPETPQ